MRLIDRLFLALLSCALSVGVFAQTQDSTVVAAKDSVAPKKTKVFLEHANTLSFDKERNAEAQVLNGDVCFRHDSSYMYCDSAYFFEQTNSLEAFSNVRMEQGDTLFVYGNYLFYDGNTQIAYLRENVRMENGQVTLFTDSLNYERIPDIGYYFDGGLIVDSLNQLSSFYGQYSPGTKLAVFNDSVRLENEQFTLYSDTLHYNTDSKIATILGPSVIVSDSGTIYSSRGWYDTVNNTSLLLDRSQVVSGDRILTGDSIAYNRELGFGEAFGNMSLQDTAQHVMLEGQYGFYNEKTEYAFATDSARFLEFSQGDTLFLHGDTLKMTTVDSLYREVKAYYGVRFYRTDMQGVCDSMQFNTRDSILYMYTDPIVWNEQYQIYGDTILIFMNDSSIDFAHVKQFAFAIQQIDSTAFNQLKGNDLKAYFEGQVVNQIDVSGNAESIFFPLEKDGSMVGMNETKSGFLTIWLKDNKLDKLKIWPTPTGTMTPIPDLKPSQKYLKDFYWFDYIRPKDKDDIYQVVKRKVQDAPKRSNKFVH
ncbi:MAG: LPS-assembly protein LptD [Parabacteroides distasonis]|uniref:OstA-like protein n=1 Tax=Parabacteroides sp. TaxID=1869337 RepID=UPI0025809499|nr:OstA-like protein [Parabacteroides sp.]